MKCEYCRQRMLPYVYDALDDAERQEMAVHVESCPLCQEALKAAQEQQGMLAEAIKQEASDLVFKAPAKVTPASTAETVVLPRAPRRSLFLLNRWAAAAAVLLFLFSAGGVLGWTVYRENSVKLEDARRRLAKAKEDSTKDQAEINRKKDQSQKEIRDIQKQIDNLFIDWKQQENKRSKELEEKRAQMPQIIVNGPQSPVAGAKNSYEIELRQEALNKNSAPKGVGSKDVKPDELPGVMPNMKAQIINQKTQDVLYWQKLNVQPNNRANFDLPPDLPIKPGDTFALEFLKETPDGKSEKIRDNLNLVFADYVTHLSTDRPIYRPGETVRFRSLTLERFSLKPAEQKFHLRYRIVGPRNVEIFNKDFASELLAAGKTDPAKTEALKGPGGAPLFGLGVGEFALPADLAEGEYTLQVSEVNERFREEKRSFLVRRWQTPRLNKEVQFHRSSYGPGDQVKLTVRVTPVQGQQAGFRNNMQIQARVVVDRANVFDQNRQTDNDGRAEFEFALPPQIAQGIGVVTVECNDGGNVETVVRNLPIVLRDLHVAFYPEGGDLIAGVPNRVYFQVRTPANRPAELTGVILDAKKQEVARVQTLVDDKEPGINQGLGSFTFTPKLGMRYSLRIDSPIGIDRSILLAWGDGLQRDPKNRGVALNIPQGVVDGDGDINLTLHNVLQPRELLVGAYCRGRMLDHKFVKVEANKSVQVALKPQAAIGGVFRITVFEKIGAGEQAAYRPLAERLIYRKNPSKVDVAIESDRATYQPGESVQLRLQAVNEKREFVPALALVAVVDASVLKLRDEKTGRAMPTHFLLTTEIRDAEDLEYADFLLGDHPKATQSLDLLLGSQGWRRFAEQDPKRFQQGQPKAKAPIFLANTATVPQFLDDERKQIDKLDEQFVPKAVELQKKLAVSEKGAFEMQQQADGAPALQAVEQVQNQIDQANQRLQEIRMFLVQFVLGGALLTLLFIGFYLISVGLRRLSEGGNPRGWLISGLSLLGLLFIISVIGTFALMGEPMGDDFRFGRKRGVMFKGGMAINAFAPAPPQAPAPLVWPGKDLTDDIEAVLAEEPLNPIANIGNDKQAKDLLREEQQIQAFLNNNANNFAPGAAPPPIGWDFDERVLRQQGDYQAIVQKHVGRRVQLPPVHELCVVREYAHRHNPEPAGVRRDFAETLYWQPVLVMPDGKAQVQFDLSDAVTRFQVLVLSNTLDGRLGSNSVEIASRLPFTVEPKTPIEVTQTDQIAIPVAVRNELAKKVSVQTTARVKGLELQENAESSLVLNANETKRTVLHVKPNISDGTASVRVVGKTGGNSDGVERKFTVVPDGFPVDGSQSGVLENAPIEHEINLPADCVPGSVKVQAHFYPSPAAELQGGMEAMLREPVGCFEQSSSSNYPNTLVLNYLKQTREANPAVEKRARQLVQTGYARLTAFECDDGAGKRGYEWFGGAAPPHEALTAYGLLQFRDMARFTAVDDAMLRRTEKFLLDQRDGKGGFKRNPKGIDQFGQAPDAITNAYIVWALTESGVKDNLDVELAALKKACKTSKDPYLLSLTALSHFNRKKNQDGIDLLQIVCETQKKDGQVTGAQSSITGSQGHDLAVESTSLAILAYLKANRFEFDKELGSAIRWLGKQRRGSGSFGGTQATILALKAMLAYHERQPKAMQGGDVQMFVRTDQPQRIQPPAAIIGGKGRAQKFEPMQDEMQGMTRAAFSPRTPEPITLSMRDARDLQPGKNVVQLSVTGNNVLPYTLSWSYRTLKPPSDPQAPVKFATKLSAPQAKEGQTVKLTATVENASGKVLGMTVAVIGLPSGLAVPEDAQQLKALTRLEKNGISAWELRGRELILYWRDLAPNAKLAVELDLVCRLPGVYRGPASRAYLYYDADRKFWVEPLNIRIAEAE
jgi:alpha-2-macroglobulin-like protein